jgi:hypothetical protein
MSLFIQLEPRAPLGGAEEKKHFGLETQKRGYLMQSGINPVHFPPFPPPTLISSYQNLQPAGLFFFLFASPQNRRVYLKVPCIAVC